MKLRHLNVDYFFTFLAGIMIISTPILLLNLPALLTKATTDKIDLSQLRWEACYVADPINIDTCKWNPTTIESAVSYGFYNSNLLVLRTRFRTPDLCKKTHCSLVISEITDVTETYLNGVKIHTHGMFDNNKQFTADPYPLSVTISHSGMMPLQTENELTLVVRSLSNSIIGVTRTPAIIVSQGDALRITESIVLERLVLPIASGFLLLSLAFLSFVFNLFPNFSGVDLRVLGAYCLVSGLRVYNLARIWRQFMPISLGFSINSILTQLYLITLIDLALTVFKGRHSFLKTFRKVSVLATLIEIIMIILNIPTSERFKLFKITALFLPIVYFYVFLVSVKRIKQDLLFLVFSIVHFSSFLLVTLDVLVLLGIGNNGMYSRFLPLVVASCFGILIFRDKFIRAKSLALSAEIGNIAATVAHDIRSPLSALKTLEKDLALDGTQKELFSSIQQRLENISSQVLNRYKTEGQKKSSKSPGSTSQSVSELIEKLLKEKAISRKCDHIAFKNEVPKTVLVKSLAIDSTLLLRILSNLIDNSLDALNENASGEISVKSFLADGKLMLFVSDNGKGIPPHILPRIGTPGMSYDKANGTGIGLSSAKDALTKLGGDLVIESQLGKGTTVQLIIPLRKNS